MEKFLNKKQESVDNKNENTSEELTNAEIDMIVDNIDKKIDENGEEVKILEEAKEFLRSEESMTKKKLFNFLRKSKRFIKALPLIVGVFVSMPVSAQENTAQSKNKSEKITETKSQEQKMIEMIFSDASNPTDNEVYSLKDVYMAIKDYGYDKVLKGPQEELAKYENIYKLFKIMYEENENEGIAANTLKGMTSYQKYCLYSGRAVYFLDIFMKNSTAEKKISSQISKDYAKKEFVFSIKSAEKYFGNTSESVSVDEKGSSKAVNSTEIKKSEKSVEMQHEKIDNKTTLRSSLTKMDETIKLIEDTVGEIMGVSYVKNNHDNVYMVLNSYIMKISRESSNPNNTNRVKYYKIFRGLSQTRTDILNNINVIENSGVSDMSEDDNNNIKLLKDFCKKLPELIIVDKL